MRRFHRAPSRPTVLIPDASFDVVSVLEGLQAEAKGKFTVDYAELLRLPQVEQPDPGRHGTGSMGARRGTGRAVHRPVPRAADLHDGGPAHDQRGKHHDAGRRRIFVYQVAAQSGDAGAASRQWNVEHGLDRVERGVVRLHHDDLIGTAGLRIEAGGLGFSTTRSPRTMCGVKGWARSWMRP